jgi:hypothetical protein
MAPVMLSTFDEIPTPPRSSSTNCWENAALAITLSRRSRSPRRSVSISLRITESALCSRCSQPVSVWLSRCALLFRKGKIAKWHRPLKCRQYSRHAGLLRVNGQPRDCASTIAKRPSDATRACSSPAHNWTYQAKGIYPRRERLNNSACVYTFLTKAHANGECVHGLPQQCLREEAPALASHCYAPG